MFGGSGTSVCVCEPQSVYTPLMYTGWVGSVRSKIRMPSKHAVPQAVVSLPRVWLQTVSPFVCGVSIDWKSRRRPLVLPERDVVLGAAAQEVGAQPSAPVREMSKTRKPS